MVAASVEQYSNERITMVGQKENTKKKRKHMRELRVYTGKRIKDNQSKRKFKGWSDEGKAFVFEITNKIKEDVRSGLNAKWETVYREIRRLQKEAEEKENKAEEAKQRYEVNYDVLYEEV